ncbi:MAG: murein biosynthesis integral membrane protein MurJ [candidate division Zixibacteria bacterium]|nr:murein biosynthesis integral membrane protein MurJ [candidate division Zixibacteria bacterium]
MKVKEEKDSIAKSTGLVSSATLLSRVFGLIREQVFAYLFGAGLATDAFVAAFRIPNLLRDLLAEGALSSAFIPVFTEKLTLQGKEEAFRLTNLIINLLLILLCVIIVLGIIFSPAIVNLIAPGFNKVEGKIELTTLLTRIMFPFLALVSLAAICMGTLNSFRRFGAPALAPALFNLGMILAGFFISPFLDPPITGMAIGVILGGIGQLAIQLPFLFRLGYKYKPILNWNDPGVRKILLLLSPAILGLASTQVNIFINTLIASLLPQGSVSYLNYSFRLMHFPLGVFGVAVATVTFPVLAEKAAHKNYGEIISTCSSSMKLIFFFTLPSAIFLAVGSKQIISLLFQHGRFGYMDTIATAQALNFYAIGLFAYASVRVLAPVFYTIGNAKIPVISSTISVGVNIILNLILMHPLSYRGLALATSFSAILNMSILLSLLHKKVGKFDKMDLGRSFLKILIASAMMGMVIQVFLFLFPLDLEFDSLGQKILLVGVMLIISLFSYILFASLLGIKEVNRILGIFKYKG